MKNPKLKLAVFFLVSVILVALPLLAACPSPSETTTPPTTTPLTTTPVEHIVLTFATELTETAAHTAGALAYMDKIEKETNGSVKFNKYFAGTLVTGKESYSQLAKGVVDMAYFSPSLATSGYVLGRDMFGFFMRCDPRTAVLIYNELCEKFPEIPAETGDLKIISVYPTTPACLISTKPVHSLNDVKGLSIRAHSAMIDLVNLLEGSPVAVPVPEIYLDLQKKIVDAALFPPEALSSLGLGEVAKYVTFLNLGMKPAPHYGMNWNSWNRLPADIQKVFEDNFEFCSLESIKAFEANDEKALALAKEMGVELIELPQEDVDKLGEILKVMEGNIASELDDKGLPGTEILGEIYRLLEK